MKSKLIRKNILLVFLTYIPFLYGEYQYNFTVCTMFRNQSTWIQEWVAYHHYILGVEHFYLYNHDSDNDYQETLAPYIEAGIVEVIDWHSCEEHAIANPDSVGFVQYQLGAFNDCLKKRAYGKAKWIAVIDMDEYIVPVNGSSSFHELLQKHEASDIAAILLNWVMFGSSYVWEILPKELMVEKLLLRPPLDFEHNYQTKCIYRPEGVEFCGIHGGFYHPGYSTLHLDRNDFRIHHYWMRTEKFFLQVRNPDLEGYSKKYNIERDEAMLQFVPKLKAALFPD